MERELEKLAVFAARACLTDDEKAGLRRQLVDFMALKPARRPLTAPNFVVSFFARFSRPAVAATLASTLLFAGAGVSWAAEGALPGDLLYPVKVEVNEAVRSFLIIAPEAKDKWEVRRAERRLEEAEQLADRSDLDATKRQQIEKNLEKHLGRLEASAKRLAAEGDLGEAAELNSDLESAVQAHGRILSRVAEGDGSGGGAEAQAMAGKLQEKTVAAQERRAAAEQRLEEAGSPEVEVAAKRRLEAARQKLAVARTCLDRLEAKSGSDSVAKARAKLAEAEKILADSQAKYDAGDYGQSFRLAQEAHRAAQAAKLLFEAQEKFQIEIELNGEAERRNDDQSSNRRSESSGEVRDPARDRSRQ